MTSSANKQKLLTSAIELFTIHGFSGVSVDDIAALAGLTKGAVYYQFNGKTALFSGACDMLVHDIIDLVTNTTMGHEVHHLDEIITGSEVLFALFERKDIRQLLLLDGPAVLGPAQWSKTLAPFRKELAQHALEHIADANLLARELVVPLSDIILGAFYQAVLATSAPHVSREEIGAIRAAYRHLVAGLLRQ